MHPLAAALLVMLAQLAPSAIVPPPPWVGMPRRSRLSGYRASMMESKSGSGSGQCPAIAVTPSVANAPSWRNTTEEIRRRVSSREANASSARSSARSMVTENGSGCMSMPTS